MKGQLKRWSIRMKIKEKIYTKCFKTVKKYILLWKIRPILGPSICGTKCDSDKPIFSQKEGVNRITMSHKIRILSNWKSQKWGSSQRNLPNMPKYRSTLPGYKVKLMAGPMNGLVSGVSLLWTPPYHTPTYTLPGNACVTHLWICTLLLG